MNLLLLVNAFLLSCVAAYYSIAGLVAIFSAAPVSIVVMGSILEVSKIVVTSWVYRNWKTTSALLRYYFVGAVIVLMLLTSMGIFGYLSKSHADQNMVSGESLTKLAILDEQIKSEKENIDANRKIISQLDSQVDSVLSRSTDESGASRSAGLRSRQAKERKAAQEEILSSQAKISKLNQERAPVAAEVRKVEAEVGPIKYIAALIYGDNLDSTFLEKAVRIVIMMIVFVFDPLAVLMFIAYNQGVAGDTGCTRAPEEYATISEENSTPESPDIHVESESVPEVETPVVEEPIQEKPINTRTRKPRKKVEWERDRVLIPVESYQE